MNNENRKEEREDLSGRVMDDIKCKRVKMRSRMVFVAEKLGLQSALFVMIILGSVLVSLVFFFIEKVRLERFLTMGMPGTKIFFLTLPYDYIIFFAIAMALAIYFANRIELFCGNCENTDKFATWFFIGALFLGIFLGAMGVGNFLGGWSKNKIPSETAIYGKIQGFVKSEVTVMDDEGEIVQVLMPEEDMADIRGELMEDKFLRAVGHRDQKDQFIFHAERVRCCDDD